MDPYSLVVSELDSVGDLDGASGPAYATVHPRTPLALGADSGCPVNGDDEYVCYAYPTGGTYPYSYSRDGVTQGQVNSTYSEYGGRCVTNAKVNVSITVKDAAGGPVSAVYSLTCSGNWIQP